MRRTGIMRTISTAAQISSAMEQRAKRSGSISSWSAFTWPPISPAAVTQRTGAEPQAHHLTAHSFRRQQGHGRQTNRTQAQFPERQHQDTSHQPERRNPCPTVVQHVLRRQHHQAKARRCTQNTDHELGDAARTNVLLASFGHAQLNTGASRMMNRALIDWNHTAGISKSPIMRLV